MSNPHHHFARLLCLYLEGRPLPQSIDEFPHPWNLLVAAARNALPGADNRLNALKPLIDNLPLSDLDTIMEGLIPVALDSLPGPITKSQRDLYAALLCLGPSRARLIAETAHQDRGNAHRRLQVLVSRGLLQREYRHDAVYYRLPRSLSSR